MNRIVAIASLLSLQLLLSACGAQLIRDFSSSAAPVSPAQTATRHGEFTLAPGQKRPPVSPRTLAAFERANRAITSEEWSVALLELHSLVDSRPDLSGPCLNLALVYRQQDEPEQAERFYRRALQVNPHNLAAHNQYAIFLRQQGRFRDAEQTYLGALAVWEAHPDTHRNIGVLYDLYLGEQQRALQHFNRYQDLTGSGDRVVAGWIADLQRQLMSVAQGGQPG
ncbi:MAG: tetratricopeptide repeat protein [Gammaproteobacteria bacterium]|nr:tetratricopeptide repeat protein [Gammaproteobacteria bacterium]